MGVLGRGIILSHFAFCISHSSAADGLDALSDDALLAELARRDQTALLERAFEQNKTPPARRDAIRAVAALARLKSDARRMTEAERRATVARVVAGINAILPTIDDPRRAAEQADALIAGGVAMDVNTLEYWGPSVATQAQLRPVVETVIALLDRADALASERAAKFAETANPNQPGEMRRVEEMEALAQLAQQNRALAGYHLALTFDPSDPKRGQAAGRSIEFLAGYDAEGNPTRANVKLMLGKLHATRGDFAAARGELDWVIASGEVAPDTRGQQFEARFFRAAVEVMARDAAAARARYAELLAWRDANPADDPSVATALALLDYRITAIEPGEDAKRRATTLLIALLERRPELEGPILAQLRAGIGPETPVASLEPLLLRSLVSDAQGQVIRGQQDAAFKPDANVVSRGFDAAEELVSRQGTPGVDERLAGDARFLAGVFLETLGRKPEAAARYLDYAEAYKSTNAPAATDALDNAQRLFAQLGGLASEDAGVTRLYDRILPLSLGEPFDQKRLAYDWAQRLQQLGRPAEAAAWFGRVERADPRFAASRYYRMVALSQQLDALPAGNALRTSVAGEIQTIADEVRAAAIAPAADERGRLAQRQRLARTAVLAAEIARGEQGDPARAVRLLDGIDAAVAGLPDATELLGEAMFTRVQANMQLGNTDAAVGELVRLLERSGGGQGAQVVFTILAKLERDFGAAQAAGDRPTMAQLQANRAALTPYLVRWSEKNSSADVRRFTYSYRVYDAETQRVAADFVVDDAARAEKRREALRLFEALDAPEGRKQYAASADPASPPRLAYDPQVALGIARVRYDSGEWPAARDGYARLLADRALGTAVVTVRDAGQEKQADNDAYWEATLRLIDAKVKAGDDVEPLKVLLREQVVRWGDRVGGGKWKELSETLQGSLIPDFDPGP